MQIKHTDTRKSNTHTNSYISQPEKRGWGGAAKWAWQGRGRPKDLTLAHQTRKTTLLNSFQSAYIISAKPKQKSNAKGAKWTMTLAVASVGVSGCKWAPVGGAGDWRCEEHWKLLCNVDFSARVVFCQRRMDKRTDGDGLWGPWNPRSPRSTMAVLV